VGKRRTLAAWKEYEKMLQADIERFKEDTGKINRDTVDLDEIRRDVEKKDQLADKIANQIEMLNVELSAPTRVVLLDEAHVAGGKDDNRKIKMTAAAGLGMFFFALFGVAWWEVRARRIGTPDVVQQALGMKLMGTLPVIDAQTRRGGARNYAQDLMIESVDALRTLLLHDAQAAALRSVMVTSAVGGEGKTSLSCHLAASLARAGQRTLLVDGDLRRPSAHRLFGLPLGQGLSEVLRGQAAVEEVVRPTEMDGLWVITAGRADLASLQSLAKKLGPIFEPLKERYDFIIVDSPPVLPVADALLIGQHVDAVVFSILRDVSRLPAVFAASERIGMLGIRILGAVLNGVRQEGYASPYHYQYVTAPPEADGV
jgi:capsular exopolysaccharide synthesis family protein